MKRSIHLSCSSNGCSFAIAFFLLESQYHFRHNYLYISQVPNFSLVSILRTSSAFSQKFCHLSFYSSVHNFRHLFSLLVRVFFLPLYWTWYLENIKNIIWRTYFSFISVLILGMSKNYCSLPKLFSFCIYFP